jgi:hypothetical protein
MASDDASSAVALRVRLRPPDAAGSASRAGLFRHKALPIYFT